MSSSDAGPGGIRDDIVPVVVLDPVGTRHLVILQIVRPFDAVSQRDISHDEVAGRLFHISRNIARAGLARIRDLDRGDLKRGRSRGEGQRHNADCGNQFQHLTS